MFNDKDTTRFWSHVDKRGPDECWLHDLDSHTIGCYAYGKRTNYSLRKFAWACERNEMLPDDVSLMPMCGNEKCVNPNHMQAVRRGTKKSDLNREVKPVKRCVERRVSKPTKPTPPRKRDHPGIFYLAYMAGFDLLQLDNGRHKVVRRCVA